MKITHWDGLIVSFTILDFCFTIELGSDSQIF